MPLLAGFGFRRLGREGGCRIQRSEIVTQQRVRKSVSVVVTDQQVMVAGPAEKTSQAQRNPPVRRMPTRRIEGPWGGADTRGQWFEDETETPERKRDDHTGHLVTERAPPLAASFRCWRAFTSSRSRVAKSSSASAASATARGDPPLGPLGHHARLSLFRQPIQHRIRAQLLPDQLMQTIHPLIKGTIHLSIRAPTNPTGLTHQIRHRSGCDNFHTRHRNTLPVDPATPRHDAS
ncbi:hypothetical protein [Streptomyces olivochromogenes]|uniref:hypothetical protein n=1 Tax=Streptomyces olivochromogenes TaxID=1963 RepID=UPI001F312B67|nr:hypothetical protein [Streptomyces olivochromogenes]MCF3130139.1 hypothetical protein [Streptomyces olivochromogenes]